MLGLGAVTGLLVGLTGTGGSQGRTSAFTTETSSTTGSATGGFEQTTSTETSTTTEDGSTVPNLPPGEGGEALATVYRHWRDIQEGDYGAAWETETQQLAGEKSTWVRGQLEDEIESVSYRFALVGPAAGHWVVQIVHLETIDRRYGCRQWTGSYGVSKEGNEWKISEASLESHPC